jgi:isocitrate dehydrogenase kinase/phosphatase
MYSPSVVSGKGRARALAHAVGDLYFAYRARFDAVTARAPARFARREWHEAQRDAAERLELYASHVRQAIGAVRARAGSPPAPALWREVKASYAAAIAGRADAEIAATFFNSVSRRLFGTVGVDAETEFVDGDAPVPDASSGVGLRAFDVERIDRAAGLRLLSDGPYQGTPPDRDGDAVARALREAIGGGPARVEMLEVVFYRNKGAYLVGRATTALGVAPVVIALLNESDGVRVDAVLTTSDEASVVFGFSWSYFRVAAAHPRALVSFLAAIMPRKRTDELYTAIGFNKHGKTELYRGLRAHLASDVARFERPAGDEGLVMTVLALPSFNLVIKLIKDTFGQPKTTTRRAVRDKYRLVFLRDRAGRLADAQEFEGLELPRRCVPDALLAHLLETAGGSARLDGGRVILTHCYTERHVTPLNVYLRHAPPDAARDAILDYGTAIKDLAGANIFTGDMLLKNFGVSRHGRVIFYDYDELALLTDCEFRRLPPPLDDDDAMRAEPWFGIGEHDVFPEEFGAFMVPAGPLRDAFLAAHADLLTVEFWTGMQARVSRGELPDVFPYRAERRTGFGAAFDVEPRA